MTCIRYGFTSGSWGNLRFCLEKKISFPADKNSLKRSHSGGTNIATTKKKHYKSREDFAGPTLPSFSLGSIICIYFKNSASIHSTEKIKLQAWLLPDFLLHHNSGFFSPKITLNKISIETQPDTHSFGFLHMPSKLQNNRFNIKRVRFKNVVMPAT